MITLQEAINIVRNKLSKDAILAYAVEDDLVYEFKVYHPGDFKEGVFSNDFCCSVDKKTGEVEKSAMLQYYQLFEPEKYDDILKTLVPIDLTE